MARIRLFESSTKKAAARAAFVEVLDDDDLPTAPSSVHSEEQRAGQRAEQRAEQRMEQRAELLQGAAPEVPRSTEGLDAVHLHALLEQEVAKGTEGVEVALRDALETKDVAIGTAERLVEQTGKLDRIRDHLEEVSGDVDRAEVVTDKLKKWKIRRLAERPFRAARELAQETINPRGTESKELKKARVAREERGLSAVLAGRVDDGRDRDVPPRERDTYADYKNETVRNALCKQDDQLEDLDTVVGDLHQLALGMNVELSLQSRLIDDLNSSVPEHTARFENNNAKIQRL